MAADQAFIASMSAGDVDEAIVMSRSKRRFNKLKPPAKEQVSSMA
jgi:hypothetical protein